MSQDDDSGRTPVDLLDAPDDPEASPTTPSGAIAAAAAPAVEPEDLPTDVPEATREHTRKREIWRLALPVMMSQILATAVSLVDIAMVGRIGSSAQAAVGYATQFFFMTQSVLFAVGFACVALMARFIGAGDTASARHAFGASLAVAVGTAVLMSAAMLAAPGSLLAWINAEPAVIELTLPYLRLVLFSTIPLAFALTLESGLRADRNTFVAMLIAGLVAGVKLLMNLLLIFGAWGFPRLELVGAGLATVTSQFVGLAAFVSVVAVKSPDTAVGLRPRDVLAGRRFLGQVFRIALPGVTERILLNLALFVYFAFLGSYGTAAVAAYTIGVRALSFTWIPGIGFAQAVGTLVGQALGRHDPKDAESIGKQAAWMSLGIAAVLGVIAGFGRSPLSRLFTQDPATVAALEPFLLCLAAAQPLLQLHFTLAGVHRGAGDTWTPLVAATIGNWGLRVPLAYVCAIVLETSILWVWFVLIFDHAVRAAWLYSGFRSGAWETKLDGRLANR